MDEQDFLTSIAAASLTLLSVIPWLAQPGTPVVLILLGIAAMYGLAFLVRSGAHARLGPIGRALGSVTLERASRAPGPTGGRPPSNSRETRRAR